MASLYLNRLSRDEYRQLVQALWETQHGDCFICEQPIDLVLHGDAVDVDHVVPTKVGGKDDRANFALTHASCNRSKQAADLRVARVLARFQRLQSESAAHPTRPNLSDVLQLAGGGQYQVPLQVQDGMVRYSFPDLGSNEVRTAPIHHDKLSGMDYFFAVVPISYLTHDDRINPRAIAASSLRRLVEEFQEGLPQLHMALAWTEVGDDHSRSRMMVFDGQHKAAAQVLLGVKELPLRVFLNPDLDKLLTANTHAGTTLRQVAFDKSVQRRLGSQLFWDRVDQYRAALNLPEDFSGFSEQDLLNHYKGQRREVLRYILDNTRDSITHHTDNQLKGYIDLGGRGTERPLAYLAVERSFYSFFIYQNALPTPLNYREDEGENPRQLEVEQIVQLMNLIAETIYVGEYDPTLGTSRLENKVQAGEPIPPGHLRAFRMSKEEILYNWLRLVQKVIEQFFLMQQGTVVDSQRLFQYRFPEPLWERLEKLITNLAGLPIWMNTSLSATVFGGKQNYDYWKAVFETGSTPSNQRVLAGPINLMTMIV